MLARALDVADAAAQLRFAAEVREWLTAPLAAVFNNAGVAVTSPTHYFDIIAQAEKRLRPRRGAVRR